VSVIAYDLNEPEVLSRLENLGSRLKIIIDDDGAHGKKDSAESKAAHRLMASAGKQNVKRQHMGKLQHNKIIIVDGPSAKTVLCGSTNFSWRGFYVQSNNALVLRGEQAIRPYLDAFRVYWAHYATGDFGINGSAEWSDLGLENVDAQVCFSPHSGRNAVLGEIAADIAKKTTSSLFYSLAFLYQTEGTVRDAIVKLSGNSNLFIYGISDKKVGGLELRKPNRNLATVFPAALSKNLPEPFRSEPVGGGGTRMHHKFIVVDFDKPTARVYTGSYNFSTAADLHNGENLLLIRDRRVAVSYMIEALRIFDHYHFRVAQREARKTKTRLCLAKPPRKPGEKPWWHEYYSDPVKIRDRELFGNSEKNR
jgi:phosphatidylserine/phosphatidylglycerophosphate/cardiolipin synthase-like enzyme